jgi:hypothetical protein
MTKKIYHNQRDLDLIIDLRVNGPLRCFLQTASQRYWDWTRETVSCCREHCQAVMYFVLFEVFFLLGFCGSET